MRSGQLARLIHVSPDTLRHYERLGLLAKPRRTASNYRDYPASSLARVQLIQRALKLGFSLAELQAILAIRERGGQPCHHVRHLLQSKLHHADAQIKSLIAFRAALRRLLKTWDQRLRRTPAGQLAHLLESLPDMLGAQRVAPHLGKISLATASPNFRQPVHLKGK